MTIEIAEHKKAIITAIQDNDTEHFRGLLADPELTQEQRWQVLEEVLDSKARANRHMLAHIIREEKTEILEAIFETPGLSSQHIYALLKKTVSVNIAQDQKSSMHYEVLIYAAAGLNISAVRILASQTYRLAPAQRFEILKNACYFVAKKYSFLNGSDGEALPENLKAIKSANRIAQIILQSYSDLKIVQGLDLVGNFVEKLCFELIFAACHGDVYVVRKILTLPDLTPVSINNLLDFHIDGLDGAHDTALMAAVRNGHIEVIEEIFNVLTSDQKMQRLQAINLYGETPLMVALRNGDVALVHRMLFGFSINQELILINTALPLAKDMNMDEMVNMLEAKLVLNAYKQRLLVSDFSEDELIEFLEETNQFGYTVLMQVVDEDDIEMLKMILSHMPKVFEKRFELLNAAVKIAIEKQRLDSLQVVLASCSDLTIGARFEGFYSNELREEVNLAAYNCDSEMVQMLLNASGLTFANIANFLDKTDENLRTYFLNMLIYSVYFGDKSTIEVILKDWEPQQKLELLEQVNDENCTVLMIAEKQEHVVIIEYLKIIISNLVSLNRYKQRLAILNLSSDEIVELLEERNQSNNTAFMQIAYENAFEIVQMVLSHMPKVSVEKRFELLNSAIRVAADREHLEILEALLASCSDLTIEQRIQGFYNDELREDLDVAVGIDDAEKVQILLTASNLRPVHIVEFLNKVNEGSVPKDTVLIVSARYGCTAVIGAIFGALEQSREEIEASLKPENGQGETAFLIAVRCNQLEVIDLFSSTPDFFHFLDLQLMHQDHNQKTAWTYAKENQDKRMYRKIVSMVTSCICKSIFISGDTAIAIKLFNSIPLEDRLSCASFNGFNMPILMCATRCNHLSMVEVILQGFEPLDQLFLLGQNTENMKTVLMVAEEQGHIDIINYLKTLVNSLLSAKKTILLTAVNQGSLEKVQYIFNSFISNDVVFQLNNRIDLLLQRNENGKTALIQALENRQTGIVSYLIKMFEGTLLTIISRHEYDFPYKVIVINNLLKSSPPNIKLYVLTHQFEEMIGYTIPMMVAYFGYFEMLPEIFSDLSVEQQATIFHMRNHNNDTMLTIAQQRGFEPMVAWLQELGARLPAAPLNDAQSTHNVMVHDSVARSAVSLMVRYLNLTPEDSLVLKVWAEGSLKDNKENMKDNMHKQVMQLVVQKATTQQAFQELMQRQLLVINQWVDTLSPDVHKQHKQAAAKRAIGLIRTHPEFVSYLESNTKIGLEQLLSLVWSGIHDEQDHRLTNAITTFETRCENGRESLVIQLCEAMRDANLTTNGQDLDPQAEDRRKCPDGFFNNLTGVLVSLKPEVAVLFVSKATVALKALFLISTLFDTAEYTEDEIIELNMVLEETNLLSSAVKNKLAPKIMQALHEEFDAFINSDVLHLRDLEQAVINALEFRGQDSSNVVSKVIKKIKSDPRVPNGTAQKEQQESESFGTVGLKRKRSRSP